jgi:hypothetical protein
MYFRITADSVDLVEPQDVTSFSVVCPKTLERDELAEILRRHHDLGELSAGDEHIWIRVNAVRRMAADRVGPSWPTDFAKMLDYAADKGWTSEDATRIRAHIERK